MARQMTLTVQVQVNDPVALRNFALEQVEEMWGAATRRQFEGKSLGDLLFEALIGSNGTMESPADYGIEIITYEVTEG